MSNQSDEDKPDGTKTEKKEFIRETIEVSREERRRKCFTAVLVFVGLAVIFGLIAAFTFALARPWMEKNVGGTEEVSESVTIPRDDINQGETEETEESEPETIESGGEEWEALMESYMSQYLETLDEENLTMNSVRFSWVRDMCDQLEPQLAIVTSRQAGEDPFENPYTRSSQTFGLVLAKTRTEVLILTDSYLLEKDAVVHVTLGDKSEYDAHLKGIDHVLEIAVVAIDTAQMSEKTLNYLQTATLGNSYQVKEGDYMIALGNPMGYVPSVSHGIVSYIQTMSQGTDMNYQTIQTNIPGRKNGSGIIVNRDGEVIGWIPAGDREDEGDCILSAMSISDMKLYIENLSNGRSMAKLGVRMQVVTKALAEEKELPEGLYISKCDKDGPAYEAGLQSGDVLVAINNREIYTAPELQSVLMELKPDELVHVKVMRKGRNGYAEQEFQVILQER
ncbi:MAG: PDZ domain-containing protein [Clostridiales bacterium]|nr:PDZ domain-containing protein [Clostridiales bacterium]